MGMWNGVSGAQSDRDHSPAEPVAANLDNIQLLKMAPSSYFLFSLAGGTQNSRHASNLAD
jgi:hypothetical protein